MIREFSVRPKPSNNKARYAFVASMLISFLLLMTSTLVSSYRGVVSLLGILALALALSTVGCSTPENIGTSSTDIEVDAKRTQLYVFNYAAGYGTEWMSAAIEEYEKLHANDVYEEGKVGVQIVPTHMKKKRDAAEILQNKEEV